MQQHAGRSATTAARFNGPISLGDLAQALDHSDEGFALTDPGGNYVYLNQAHLRIYGYAKLEDLLGRSWRVLYDPDWIRHIETSVLPLLPRAKVWRGRVVGRRRDGSSFPAAVTLTLLPDGKITCNCRDESATPPDARTAPLFDPALLEALPPLLLRSVDMVNACTSFLRAEIPAAQAPSTIHSVLTDLDSAGRQTAVHLRRFARLARLSRGGEPCTAPPPNHPDFHQIESAARQLASDSGRSDDLHVALDPAPLDADTDALECIVMELLANALQASGPGDRVEILGRTRHGCYLLDIRDQGIGLPQGTWPPPALPTIGQQTFTGMGLRLVTAILTRLHGAMEVVADDAFSTCIRLRLPLAETRVS